MNIKVQILGKISKASFIHGEGEGDLNDPITFIAHSPHMKAHVLDMFLHPDNVGKVALSPAGVVSHDGEWHEPLAHNAITNVSLCDNVKQCHALFNSENNVGNNYCPAM